MKRGKVLLIVALIMLSIGMSLIAIENFAIGVFLLLSAVVVLLFALIIGAKEKRMEKK
ncbi:MAG: hypothetical protein LBE34_05190 [Flavobacteriaceae bacterium]|jgi:membrane-bound ClpP family serine protease|nr:hypothetical protein [Flavobacteriaceae bacterium]MDR2222118.1 hypothetical protein [Flavobacteriaceae bacterium]